MDVNSLPHAPQYAIDAMNKSTKQIDFPPLPQEQTQSIAQTQQPEPVPEESVQNYQSEPEITQSAQEQAPEATQESIRDYSKEENLRVIRKRAAAADKFERERNEAYKKIQEYESYNSVAKSQQMRIDQPQKSNSRLAIGQDDLVEGKHLSALEEEVQDLKQQISKNQQEAILAATEARLKSQYQDFDTVVSEENLQTLKILEPELAAALDATPNLYIKAVSAYKLIKDKVEPLIRQEEHVMKEKKKIAENLAKPRLSPTAATAQQGDSALSKANMFADGLTPDMKAQLWKEMQSSKKNY